MSLFPAPHFLGRLGLSRARFYRGRRDKPPLLRPLHRFVIPGAGAAVRLSGSFDGWLESRSSEVGCILVFCVFAEGERVAVGSFLWVLMDGSNELGVGVIGFGLASRRRECSSCRCVF